jgi:hypothetical protein
MTGQNQATSEQSSLADGTNLVEVKVTGLVQSPVEKKSRALLPWWKKRAPVVEKQHACGGSGKKWRKTKTNLPML